MTMLYAVKLRCLDYDDPGRVVDIADLLADNADDPGQVIEAVQQLRRNVEQGDYLSTAIVGGGAAPEFELSPVWPGDLKPRIDALVRADARGGSIPPAPVSAARLVPALDTAGNTILCEYCRAVPATREPICGRLMCEACDEIALVGLPEAA